MCFIQFASSRSGKSSCACAPRLSLRASAPTMVVIALPIRLSQLQRLDEIGIPDQAAIGTEMSDSPRHTPCIFVDAFGQASCCCGTPRRGSAWCAASRAAVSATLVPPLAWRARSKRASAASPAFGGSGAWVAPGLTISAARMRGGAAEHHEVEQRIGAEPVGAMHRDAGRLADRHQPGHHRIRVGRGRAQHFAVDSSSARRPCCSARSAAPGSAPWSHRRRRTPARSRKCRAGARAAVSAPRCSRCSMIWSLFGPQPRPSLISIVIERDTTSRDWPDPSRSARSAP